MILTFAPERNPGISIEKYKPALYYNNFQVDNSGNACCGAFLPGTPFYAQFFVAAMALSAALTLKEPVIHFATHVHSLKKTAGDIREALVEYADLRI